MKIKNLQSAAKPLNKEESSETISKESTLDNISNGSGSPSACNDGGDDIVHKRNFNKFVDKANEKYNNKFDYSLAEYISAKTKIKIICPEHGVFEQTPDKHLQSKFGCPECVKKYKNNDKAGENSRKGAVKRQITKEKFIEMANNKYGNKFSYIIDNWVGLTKSKITIICPIHGEQIVGARTFLKENTLYGCPECAHEMRVQHKITPYEEVVKEMQEKWNNYYIYPDYNKDSYENKKSKIKIICPKHGEFIKSVQKHLSGQGCYECAIENLIEKGFLPGGYCDQVFEETPELKDVPAVLYYFKINDGKYYKVGISRNDPSTRAKSLKHKAHIYNEDLSFTLIKSTSMSLYQAFKLEQLILEKYKEYRIYKKWSTELFKIDIYDLIKEYFEHSQCNIEQETH